MSNHSKGDLVHIPSQVYLFKTCSFKNSTLFNEDWKVTRKTKEPQLGIFIKYTNEKSGLVVLNDGEWVIDARHIYAAEADYVDRVDRNKVQLRKQI
jgi:hypothetical protein